MKTLNNIFILSIIIVGLAGCVDESESYPLAIVTGKEKVDDLYYQKVMKDPAVLKGTIKSLRSSLPVSEVEVIAKAVGLNLQYKCKTKVDGSYHFYVEGQNEYVLYTQKPGWEKHYFFSTYNNDIDTVYNFSASNTVHFSLFEEDSIREVPPLFIATRYLTNYLEDLTVNSGVVLGMESNRVFQYNDDATLFKTSLLKNYPDYIAVQDTFYWYGNTSGRTIYKVGMTGGKQFASAYCQIANENIYDLEIINNTIWIITSTRLYHLSIAGDLIKSYNFSSKIASQQFVGMAKGVNSLYILNKVNQSSVSFPGYKIYKFDTSTEKLTLQTGNFSKDLNKLTLRNLAFKNGIFWTISDGYNTDDIVRIRVTE